MQNQKVNQNILNFDNLQNLSTDLSSRIFQPSTLIIVDQFLRNVNEPKKEIYFKNVDNFQIATDTDITNEIADLMLLKISIPVKL